jgi:transposase-like protein
MQLCPHCQATSIIKKNFYFIKHSRSYIRRFLCLACNKSFSSRTFSPTYKQSKPYLNNPISKLLASGNTERRTAKLLGCSKNTVAKKLLWISKNLHSVLPSKHDAQHIQIDELETIEHTKLKPLTIPMCVSHTYKILGVAVGMIPAKGHLAEISRKKYGYREDNRAQTLTRLLENLAQTLPVQPLTITTDKHPLYPKLIAKYFPSSKHIQVNAGEHLRKKRELIYTAEMKRLFDPLFAINQRFAMLRSDIRRLTRRSWCTTKKIENLQSHLELYRAFNNLRLS